MVDAPDGLDAPVRRAHDRSGIAVDPSRPVSKTTGEECVEARPSLFRTFAQFDVVEARIKPDDGAADRIGPRSLRQAADGATELSTGQGAQDLGGGECKRTHGPGGDVIRR